MYFIGSNKNLKPTLKETSGIIATINQNWASLCRSLNTHINQMQPLKKSLLNRKYLIQEYKENLSIIKDFKE
jgi:hypothetical protein